MPRAARRERLRHQHVGMDARLEVLEELRAGSLAPAGGEEVDELRGLRLLVRARLGDGHAATSAAASAICCWMVIGVHVGVLGLDESALDGDHVDCVGLHVTAVRAGRGHAPFRDPEVIAVAQRDGVEVQVGPLREDLRERLAHRVAPTRRLVADMQVELGVVGVQRDDRVGVVAVPRIPVAVGQVLDGRVRHGHSSLRWTRAASMQHTDCTYV